MKRLLLPLLAALALPTVVNAEAIPKISDYELLSKEGEKFLFKCPKQKVANDKGGKTYKKMYEECWFQINENHINIMDMQKIGREDIIVFYPQESSTDKVEFIKWVFIYKLNGNIKRIEFEPITSGRFKFKMGEYYQKLEAINIWLNK